jgi:hypothetical protein
MSIASALRHPNAADFMAAFACEIASLREMSTFISYDDDIKLNISDQSFNLDNLDIHNIEEPKLDLLPDLLIDDIEILE